MIKKYYKIKEHIVKEPVFIQKEIFCDTCGNKINDNDRYFSITTGHHGWGHDSIDSIEHICVCGSDCLYKAIDQYINDVKRDPTSEHYIEINHGCHDDYCHKNVENYIDGKKTLYDINYEIGNEE